MDMAVSQQHEGAQVEPGKLFVGGLSWDTRKESFAKYFSTFGELQEATVIMDDKPGYPGSSRENGGKNKGFGFVKFVDPEHAENVLKCPEHIIDGKKVDAKRAVKGEKYKVFVGGIPADADREDLRMLMSKYGEISEEEGSVDLKTSPGDGTSGTSSRNRGFGFVTFKSKKSMETAVSTQFVSMTGKTGIPKKVEMKVAVNPAKSGQKTRQYQQGFSAAHYPSYAMNSFPQYSTPDYNGYGTHASQGYHGGNHSYPASYNLYANSSSQQQMGPGFEQQYSNYSGSTGYEPQGYFQQQQGYGQGTQNGGSWGRQQAQQSSAYAYGGQAHPAVRQ